jgi:hypothetical protein
VTYLSIPLGDPLLPPDVLFMLLLQQDLKVWVIVLKVTVIDPLPSAIFADMALRDLVSREINHR